MKILALELSSGRGSIAWRDGEREPRETQFANDRKHSGLFFSSLRKLLGTCGNADRIVVGIGPGSYAGTRIAIAAAIGLQTATGAELVGLPSLCTLPTAAEEYCVIGDARRQSFFFARVQDRGCVEGPILHHAAELHARLSAVIYPVFTSEPLSEFPGATVAYPSAAVLAVLAAEEHPDLVGPPLQPLYLRDPHITQPRSG